MAVTTTHKKTLSKKLFGFQKSGLEQYGRYLSQQLKMIEGKKGKDAYRKYIQQQLASTEKKIGSLAAKLKNL